MFSTNMEKIVKVPSSVIGYLPIMVGSNVCHTTRLTKAALMEIEEDPDDLGGYFIILGHIFFQCLVSLLLHF